MKIKRYQVRFSDGRVATVLDMDGDDPAVVVSGIYAQFATGYVIEVIHVS